MLWTILVAVLVLLLIWNLLGEDHPLDHLPGPRKLPIVGCIFEFYKATPRNLFVQMRHFVKIYGDRYFIKILHRRILHLNNPKDIEIVLSHARNITKSKPYQFLIPWLGTGLLLSTGSKWHRRRKILTPTFHFNILKNFAAIIEEKSRDLVTKLKQLQGEDVSLYQVISDFTINTICETAMGTQLDHDQSAATVEYKSSILQMGGLLLTRFTRVWLHSDFVFKRTALGQHFFKVIERAHKFADNVILERKKRWQLEGNKFSAALEGEDVGAKRRLAMLDLLLEAESKGEIDLEGIREEVNTFMFEGHDTTAQGISFALMLLADHEEVQERIHEEIVQIFGNSDRVPTLSDCSEMKYLEAVIKETLRLYPSVPFIARTITEDFMMGDLLIQKGVEVAVHIYDLHRREDLYPEPEAFRPERFLGGVERHPYAFIPFSAGPRNCIGQRFAMQEMKCVLSEICRNFKLEPKIKGFRPELLADMVLRSDPVYIRFIQR